MSEPEGKRKVLVIDDERGPRESLRILLKRDYEITTAESFDAGFALFKSRTPDVVILDIRMPGKNGIDGLREIRSIDRDTAVIILTGYGDLRTAREAIQIGANDYICKPFDANEMPKIVQQNIDRTDRNRAQSRSMSELYRMNEELSRQVSERKRMAEMGIASSQLVHDISNPLTIVTGYLDLLNAELKVSQQNDRKPPPDVMQYIEMIESNLRYCASLLHTWRASGQKAVLTLKPLSLSALLREVAVDAIGPGCTVQIVPDGLPSEGCTVHADRMQLTRALTNLVVNALQAVDPRTGRIRLRCRSGEGRIRIEIADNGPGIRPDIMDRVFEPFFTTKKQGKGTGLGLFISRQIIEDHGGTLSIANQPGGGAVAVVELPERPA